jgi:hypothetical protein
MHYIAAICQWLERTRVGSSVRESLWLFPVIETVHIFGIILLVGATSILDLRLMGLTFRDEPVSKLAQRFLPWAWAGFLIQVCTGLLLFSSEATKMYDPVAPLSARAAGLLSILLWFGIVAAGRWIAYV